ncbi:class I SAM-dependent methyltransferase [Streptomyces salyersiae]|uniref:Class I SAM-dependent methyltransferase n=1 Tax=Streptomyces salyersiae TaxID=3075530 RepID=A0ABU2RPX4_9ACTN|nr:class I SAM-dependent methyltransferase [Streptomyces sp. DSM 41770]MDT0429419.1 class I SAM-dependent methyltransferase [Streptomyces sp. DSM 41770]
MAEAARSPAAVAFDAIGSAYERAFAGSAAHRASLGRLLEELAPHSRILDVGSGTGRPTAGTLAGAGHEVLGVDVSPVMVDLASRRVPEADFRCADIRGLPLEPAGYDAVCVYFALLQMSRADQTRLVRRLAGSLRPGGRLVLATVPLDVEDVAAEFMGQEVRVTSFGPEALGELVTGAGLTVEWERHTVFTPDRPAAVPEPQVFLHCTRR